MAEQEPAGRFWVEVTPAAGALRVTPHGELDLATVPVLESALSAPPADQGPLVIDLSRLRFMDSSGLRLILKIHRRAGESGRRLELIRGRPSVHRVFEITRLEDRLPFVAPEPAS